jgi:glycosyltransferase involved in cell wall biosynthesis
VTSPFSAAHVFVCPSLDGPLTGGTLYNRELLGALATCGVAARALTIDEAMPALRDAPVSRANRLARLWVDTLYLEHVPLLRHESAGKVASLGLVVHYLPSLVALGRAPTLEELSTSERGALDSCTCFLSTSTFMQKVLMGAGIPAARIVAIAPGVDWFGEPCASLAGADTSVAAASRDERPHRRRPLFALMIANLLPGKGVAPFIRALDRALELDASRGLAADGDLCLSIAGSVALDEGYARECRHAVSSSPRARSCVRLEGPLSRQALFEKLSSADVLVSASRMESFGLALAEARGLGVPILARAAGNAPSLVEPASGGELFTDDAPLARALVRLAHDPDELRARTTLAKRHRLRRSWRDAAVELVAAVEGLRRAEES